MATAEEQTPQKPPASTQSGGILGKVADLIYKGLVIFIYGKAVSETAKEIRSRQLMVVGTIGALLILGIVGKAMLGGDGSTRRPPRERQKRSRPARGQERTSKTRTKRTGTGSPPPREVPGGRSNPTPPPRPQPGRDYK